MRSGRPKKPIDVTGEEREALKEIALRGNSGEAMALRAQVVLGCAEGINNVEIARRFHISGATVGKWRERFRRFRIDGLRDEPRAGAPPKITGGQIQEVVRKTLEPPPAHRARWSTRLMAKEMGLSQNAIVRIWRRFGLQPHRASRGGLFRQLAFIGDAPQIAGLFLNPPDRAVALYCDNRTPSQSPRAQDAHLPGSERPPQEPRLEMSSLFAAVDAASALTLETCWRRPRHRELLQFLIDLEKNLPIQMDVQLVMHDYGTHRTDSIQAWLGRRPHFHLHLVPAGGIWLNLVSQLLSDLIARRGRYGGYAAVPTLERALLEYLEQRRHQSGPFSWTATAGLFTQVSATHSGA